MSTTYYDGVIPIRYLYVELKSMYTIIEQENKNLFQKTLDDLKVQIKFVGTFGFGITGLYETVQDLLAGRYPTLSEQEIILIFLAALSYFSIDVIDDIKKMREIIKEKGLEEYVRQTTETLKDIENIAIKVAEKSGHVVSSLAELTGYIFLLVPILEVVQTLIAREDFDIVTLGSYLKSLLASVGIFYTKNIFNKLIQRLKRSKTRKDDDLIKEHEEKKDELRRVLDKYEKDARKISPELIIDLAIEDPSPNYEYLDWMVNQIKMGFFLGVDLKYIVKIIKQFHGYKSLLTPGRILRMVSKFKELFPGPWVWNNDEILDQILENPADINNYPGYGQLEQILQMISYSTGGVDGNFPTALQEQTNYLQKKGEQSTRKVVRDILKIIKEPEADEEFYHLPDYFSGIDGDMYEFGDLEFIVYLNVVEYESLDEPFIVDAEIGGDYDDEIYVTITMGPEFSTQNYEDLQMILNDYVRHEIEHVIDATEGGNIESPDDLSPYDYYMQPHEVRAQKAGFNRRAKLEKKPVEDIIYDYLEYRQKIDKLSDEEKSNLTKTLSEHRGKGERYNQPLEEGDVIELIYMDDPYSPVSPLTRGVVMGFEDVPFGEPKILVRWIIDAENEEFRNMPMIPEVDVWKKIDSKDDLINEQETEFKPSGKLGTITNPHPKTPSSSKDAVAGEYYVNSSTGSIMKFVPGTSKKPYHYTHTGKYAWKKEVEPPTSSEKFISSYFPCPDHPYGGASYNWYQPRYAKENTRNYKDQPLKYWSRQEVQNYNDFATVQALAANALISIGSAIKSRSEWCKTTQGKCNKGMFNRKGWEENLYENLQKGKYCCPRYTSTQRSLDEYVRKTYGEAQGTPNWLAAYSVEVGAQGKKQCEIGELILSEVDSEWKDPLYEFVTGLGGWFYNTFIECDDTWDCIQNALDGIAIVAAFIPGPGWVVSVVAGLGSAGISIAKEDYAMGGAMLAFELFPATRIGRRIFKYGPKAVKSSDVDAVLNKMLKSDFDANVYKSLKGDQKKTADYLLKNIDDIEADVLKAVKNLKNNRMSRDLMKLNNWELRQVAKVSNVDEQSLVAVVGLMKNQAKNIDDYAKFFSTWRKVLKEIAFGVSMIVSGIGTYLGIDWVKKHIYGGDEELMERMKDQYKDHITGGEEGLLNEDCMILAEILILTDKGCNVEFNNFLDLETYGLDFSTRMEQFNYYLREYEEEKERFDEIKYILQTYAGYGTKCNTYKWKEVGGEYASEFWVYYDKAKESGGC